MVGWFVPMIQQFLDRNDPLQHGLVAGGPTLCKDECAIRIGNLPEAANGVAESANPLEAVRGVAELAEDFMARAHLLRWSVKLDQHL